MRAVVVCESWFGNTRRLAEEIAAELGTVADAEVLTVDDAAGLANVDLLVIGAPTHAHGLSRASTRRTAARRLGRADAAGRGTRGWLHRLSVPEQTLVAVFDTRIEKPTFLVGSAARSIARKLERNGYRLAVPPESFFVLDVEGPLKDGEIERARAWATVLTDAGVAA